MKKLFKKSLTIAIILILSINGCINGDKPPDPPVVIVEYTEVQTDSQHIVESSGTRGWQYFWNGDYDSSLEMFQITLEMIELQDLHQIAYFYNNMGLLHNRLRNYNQAEHYTNRAFKIAQINSNISSRLRALHNFVALRALHKDTEQFDTVMDIKNSLLAEHQQLQHEVNQKNSLLSQQTEQIQRKWNIIVFLVVIIGLAIILSGVAILFYRNNVRKTAGGTVQHFGKKPKSEKEEIQSQHNDSEKSDASEKLASDIQHLFEIEKIHHQQGLSVDDVAKRLDISNKQLSNAINQYYGKNFAEYVNTFRVQDAKEMLKQQGGGGKYANYTIQAIGEMAGFSDRTAFYRAFKRITNVTPSKYINTTNTETEAENTEQ